VAGEAASQPLGRGTLHRVSGGCHCGNLQLTAHLTRPPADWPPRACDCDFCRKHGACYVSDPQGTLDIRVRDERQLARYAQGSGLAELLLCRRCGVLIAALYQGAACLYGVVNAQVLDERAAFGPPQQVSPQTLSAAQKAQRWQSIWFPAVTVRCGGAP
jgi:hypothetical protein